MHNSHQFPTITVDIVLFALLDNALHVFLLPANDATLSNHWQLPGAIPAIQESFVETIHNINSSITDSSSIFIEQLYTYNDPSRIPGKRVVSVSYFGLVSGDHKKPGVSLKSVDANGNWFSIMKLPHLVFDHQKIIQYAIERLRYKIEYSAVGFELLPSEFTLSELQQTYEAILGESLDKRNFRRRILSSDIIEEIPDKYRPNRRGRPARLYRYKPDAIAAIKARRLFP